MSYTTFGTGDTVHEDDVFHCKVVEALQVIGQGGSGDGLERIINEEDNNEYSPGKVGQDNVQETTRETLLRHMRWLDELKLRK